MHLAVQCRRRTNVENIAERHTQQRDPVEVTQADIACGAHQPLCGVDEAATGPSAASDDSQGARRREQGGEAERTEPVERRQIRRCEYEVVAVRSGFRLDQSAIALFNTGCDSRVRLNAATESDDGPARFVESVVRTELGLATSRRREVRRWVEQEYALPRLRVGRHGLDDGGQQPAGK
ncbi:hypothetical protein ABZX92_16575 [Lentzea sp. NPDC006480]|uniref:hypothetical protein n=1 Tax=Lentzea sp. NPDC006480 TaxID=3157176 RepID=UPI0033ABF8A2